MRGNTLLNIRSMLGAELGYSTAANTARDAQLNVLISNKQKWLATEYNWPFLEQRWDVGVAANAQYIALPTVNDQGVTTALNLERMPFVEVKWNTKYQPVEYGIGEEEYNALDIALGQQSDPIQRWRMSSNVNETANPNKFEVWPVPVTAQTIRFTGQRTLQPLLVDADLADLDDMLLVYAVAGDKLTGAKQADAQVKAQEALRRLQWIKQNYPTRDKRRVLGSAAGRRDVRTVGMTIVVR